MPEKTCILYVDDEPDIRMIVEMSLKMRPDFDVHTAGSGQEALDLLAGGLRPDLMMVDVMMPGLSGPEVLIELQSKPETRDLPLIFVTARARPQDVEEYLALGAKGVVTKPFDPMSLPDQVMALIG